MVSKRIFYRNVIAIEVLSEEPLSGNESLSDIAYLINEGPCSGKVETTIGNEQVDGRRMAQLLNAQESDTEFFGLDEEGRDVDDDEEEAGENGGDNNDIQETMYEGEVSVELTGLAVMRQRRIILLEKPLPQSAVEELGRKTACDHTWDYMGMQDETIEVMIVS
jgi:hypothetical protein